MMKSGYDPSVDFTKYPTLAPLPRSHRGEFLRCAHCGGVEFLFRKTDGAAVCKKCGKMPEMSRMMHPAPKQPKCKIQILDLFDHTIILNRNGGIWAFPDYYNVTPIHVGGWPKVVSIARFEELLVGLRPDGSLLWEGFDEDGEHALRNWSGLIAIDFDCFHIAGLFADGTVRAVGDNDYGQCNVQNWTNITAVAAGGNHTVGLCADGTVRATGNNDQGQCNVEDWKNIIAITVSYSRTIGLCADGTVRATGDNYNGACNTQDWTEITAIAASRGYTLGLCADGTICQAGTVPGSDAVSEWTDVIQLVSEDSFVAAVRRDGTILCTDPGILEKINEAHS